MTSLDNTIITALPPAELIQTSVQRGLAEDIGSGDVSAQLVPDKQVVAAKIINRQAMVLCGSAWVEEVFRQIDVRLHVEWLKKEGERLEAGSIVCKINGPTRSLLTAERTALNFLQSLSGTATVARRYADAVAGTGVTLLDTRKTLPGWRQAQKYAVRCGGCCNHRMGLYDAYLIKENHIRAAAGITNAVNTAKQNNPGLPIEVEVESLAQLKEAIEANPSRIMLDNFDVDQIRAAVEITGGRVPLEASGNITFDTIRGVAETGIDFISIGALTKDISAADLSLLLE